MTVPLTDIREWEIDPNVIRHFVETSTFHVTDKQRVITATKTQDRYILAHNFNITPSEEPPLRHIELNIEECKIMIPFYKSPRSLVSLATFSIIPFTNVYDCETRLDVFTNERVLKKSFSFTQRVAVGVGFITLAVGWSLILKSDDVKVAPSHLLLYEAASDGL